MLIGEVKIPLALFLIFLADCACGQRLNVRYRTATDSTERLHYLVFVDNSRCRLIFPARNHGDAMVSSGGEYELKYSIHNDTITFDVGNAPSDHKTIRRLKKSGFVVIGKGRIFDTVSGYTYVDSRLVNDRHDIYAVDGEVFRTRRSKVDAYGILRRSYRINLRLRKRIKKMNVEVYQVNFLRGKTAFEKYGLDGMNGVIEIEEKK